MKKYLGKAKKVLTSSCAVFTVLYFLFLILSGAMGNLVPALPLRNSSILYLFSLLLALCDLIFEIKRIKFPLRLLCHFGASLISAMLCLGLAGYSLNYKTPVMIFVFFFIYATACPIYIFIGKKHKKGAKVENQSDYVSIFKKD